RASAEQRAGRAGRLGPGICFRLFSRHTLNAMTPHTPAEMLETDLAPLVLELAAWGVADPGRLSWLDPPPPAALAAARRLLTELSALDEAGRITPVGSAMAGLPLHPRLARLLLRSQELGCPGLGCDLGALLSERDIVRRAPPGSHGAGHAPDVADRVELLREWRTTGRTAPEADMAALKGVERVSRHVGRLVRHSGAAPDAMDPDMVGRLLLAAWPDRVARVREGEAGRYLLANGRGCRLAHVAPVRLSQFLIAVSVDGGEQGEGIIHLAAPVTEVMLRAELDQRIEHHDDITWDGREGRVIAAREERIGAVRLSVTPFVPASHELLPVVIEAVRASSLGLLSLDGALRQLQGRVAVLRRAFPDDGWPDLSDGALLETLDEWLAPNIHGIRTAQGLADLDAAAAVGSLLDYRHKQALDRLAPTHVEVPSGSRIRLDYADGAAPVLAVKLQELFGLGETPTVAAGRVGVLLHLLSPAGRPIQVTRDLRGFWNGAYHEVKKELKGRYPKHPWPDDPWSAPPTRRAKPRT
ncbi:MAG TPA: ATP-dependent helicase C-terminal domain-containing protein, partial [Desulfuromonadaceae bacterium]